MSAADELNGRPHKKLGYRTPEELFDAFLDFVYTQPKAAAASPRMEASGFHPDRRSDSHSSTVQVSNLHLQFAEKRIDMRNQERNGNVMKKIAAFVLVIVLLLAFTLIVSASSSYTSCDVSDASVAFNLLNAQDKQIIYAPLVQQILDDYSEFYRFENFEFRTHAFEKDGESYLAIDVIVDMTLTQNPIDDPYFDGMAQGIANSTKSTSEKALLSAQMNARIQEITEECYMIPNRTTFPFAIEADMVQDLARKSIHKTDLDNYYYRVDAAETILYRADELSKPADTSTAYNAGYAEALKMEADLDIAAVPQTVSNADYTYDRIAARDWALDNVWEDPEYPSDAVPGSDCANFVSKALCAGGIPEDLPGLWYGASTWGGWPGKHWFRTGNGTDGGVVPYMIDNGYFYLQNDLTKINAGCIMSWVNISHVALVTYGDTHTIKYTAHSQPAENVVYSTSVPANFYMYN